jgi:outer membrane lipoprotein-sorting protein
MPTGIGRRTGVSLVTSCICVLALASCGTDRQATVGESRPAEPHTSGHKISAHYTLPEGEIGLPRVTVTTAGPDRIRFEWDIPEDDPPTHWLVIYDGDRLFAHLTDFRDPYQVYDSPDHFGGLFYDYVRSWVLLPGSARLAEACPDAQRLGTRAILGRTAVGYRCGRSHAEMVTAREMWVDRTTGLVLRAGRVVADEVDPHPQIDESTFSTTPPDGVEVRHFPAR